MRRAWGLGTSYALTVFERLWTTETRSIREGRVVVVNEGGRVFFRSLCRRSRRDCLIRTQTRLVNRWDGWKGIRAHSAWPVQPDPWLPACQPELTDSRGVAHVTRRSVPRTASWWARVNEMHASTSHRLQIIVLQSIQELKFILISAHFRTNQFKKRQCTALPE